MRLIVKGTRVKIKNSPKLGTVVEVNGDTATVRIYRLGKCQCVNYHITALEVDHG
jgi:hypothetical protein